MTSAPPRGLTGMTTDTPTSTLTELAITMFAVADQDASRDFYTGVLGFEVVTQRRTGKLAVLATALRAATRGLGRQPSTTHYAFTTLAPMPLQLDGELVELEADTPVAVAIARRARATVL